MKKKNCRYDDYDVLFIGISIHTIDDVFFCNFFIECDKSIHESSMKIASAQLTACNESSRIVRWLIKHKGNSFPLKCTYERRTHREHRDCRLTNTRNNEMIIVKCKNSEKMLSKRVASIRRLSSFDFIVCRRILHLCFHILFSSYRNIDNIG